MEVYLSPLAESRLLKINEYLLEEWNVGIRDRFIEKLTEKINQIADYPDSCPRSTKFNGLYKCVLTSQITFYYRVKESRQEIEIITFFDTRQNPDSLRDELYSD